MLTSSGQAASFYSVFNICGAGDHVVSSSTIYGGTYNLFAVTMKRMGIDFTFVDPDCSDEEMLSLIPFGDHDDWLLSLPLFHVSGQGKKNG